MPIISEPPGTPRKFVVTDVNRDRVSLAWEPPEFNGGTEITEYIIEYRLSKDSKYTQAGTVGPSDTCFTKTGLKEGAKYAFRVKAVNAAGESTTPAKLDGSVKVEAPAGKIYTYRATGLDMCMVHL